MKLATINDGSRDGKLIVVSKDLTKALPVPHIADTLQSAIDNWDQCAPLLKICFDQLNQNLVEHPLDFSMLTIAAPLPRAYQWADGSAYVNHIELVRKARGAEMPENFWHDPLMYQGGSDVMLGAKDNIFLTDVNNGLDFEAEIAVITNDVPLGCSAKTASSKIILLMLVNDVSLRNLIPNELAKGFGFFQSKPSTAFSPVAITPDELGSAWKNNKVNLPLLTYLNNKLFGCPNAGQDMTFDFAQLISHAAKTRSLSAGTIIGSGTVSNYDRSLGSSCIAEKRMLEIINNGKATTPFMQENDKVKIEMLDENNQSIFGSIEQQVVTSKKNIPEKVC